MTVDNTLTSEQALQRIGGLERITNYGQNISDWALGCFETKVKNFTEKGVKLELESPYWKMQWEFSPDSKLVELINPNKLLKLVKTNRNPGAGEEIMSYLSSENHIFDVFHSYLSLTKDDCPNYRVIYSVTTEDGSVSFESKDLLFKDMRYKENSKIFSTLSYEAIGNALEHGTSFKEPILVSFVGGINGCAIFVDDFGKGFDLKQRSVDEIVEIWKGVGILFHQPPKTYEDLSNRNQIISSPCDAPQGGRGLGCSNFSLYKQITVGSEKRENGFRMILLYEKPYGEKSKLFSYISPVKFDHDRRILKPQYMNKKTEVKKPCHN